MSCKTCNGDGGWLVNPDYPMGDCGDREWHSCPDCDSPGRKDERWHEHLREYRRTRFGSPAYSQHADMRDEDIIESLEGWFMDGGYAPDRSFWQMGSSILDHLRAEGFDVVDER